MGAREEIEVELDRLRGELEDLENMDPFDVIESYSIEDYEDLCSGLRSRIEELEVALG